MCSMGNVSGVFCGKRPSVQHGERMQKEEDLESFAAHTQRVDPRSLELRGPW